MGVGVGGGGRVAGAVAGHRGRVWQCTLIATNVSWIFTQNVEFHQTEKESSRVGGEEEGEVVQDGAIFIYKN